MASQGTAPIQIDEAERLPLREAMRDVQIAVADYYAATSTADELGSRVRSFLVSAQTLNDLYQYSHRFCVLRNGTRSGRPRGR